VQVLAFWLLCFLIRSINPHFEYVMCVQLRAYQRATCAIAIGPMLCCSRFILNIPEEEFKSSDRLFFQIEQAHWFYLDFYRERNPQLPNLTLQKFGEKSMRRVLICIIPAWAQWLYSPTVRWGPIPGSLQARPVPRPAPQGL
jgi:hypothetical protein